MDHLAVRIIRTAERPYTSPGLFSQVYDTRESSNWFELPSGVQDNGGAK